MTNGTIIDSSVWVDYFNGIINFKTDSTTELIKRNEVFILPVILQEVLQGIKEDKLFNSIRETLVPLEFIIYHQIDMSVAAASLYRNIRAKGITIRKPNDCLIASICIDNHIPLLHNDKDFDNIAKHTSLKIYKPTK
ncbi:MAG TPA: PIN domain-containing protein [Hanamia sp.]|nr:PIN domain-containing protein [Hanamia sp.]